jgi:uncharacterized protein (TIGR02996 family)
VSVEALIAAIVAEPDQEAPWLVYADWLLEREDVRGELIHFALDGTEGALRRMSLLEQDLEPLLSQRLFAQRSHWHFGWRRGFLCRVTTSDLPFEAEALAALCADPHAVLLEELRLAGFDHRRPEQLRAPPFVELDEIAAFPRLRQLTLTDVRASQLAHPYLRSLTTDASCAFANTGAYDLPELVHWDLATSEALFTVPTSLLFAPPPKLRTLELSIAPQHLELLGGLPIMRQLRTLSLRGADADLLAVLRDHAALFGTLESIEARPQATIDVAAGRALRTELERAFSATKLAIDWNAFLLLDRLPKSRPPVVVDAMSRTADGRIDATAAWIRGPRNQDD